jgi:pimeloyl-ACP methyl ester carboxylesterase
MCGHSKRPQQEPYACFYLWSDDMKRTALRNVTSRAIHIAFVLIACIGMGALPAYAADLKPGTHAGLLQGALFRIDIPANWNGDLVMVMHGYQPVGAPIMTPMRAADATADFLKLGYAVAQSQYASQGWAVGDAITDNERLRRYFIRAFVKPKHTYIYGFSLGGLETLASIERYPHTYTGALTTCAVAVSTPELISRAVLTPLVAFDALIPGVLPDLAAPYSPAFIPQDVFAKALQAHPKEAAILEKRLQEEKYGTLPTLSLYYMTLRELERRAGGMPVDNRTTIYHGFGDDAAFNRRVHRYAGSTAAMAYAQRNVTLTGHIDTPLVMQWNTFDPTVPERFHSVYPGQVRAAGNGKLLTVLDPVGEGHCNFTDVQTISALETLVSKANAEAH